MPNLPDNATADDISDAAEVKQPSDEAIVGHACTHWRSLIQDALDGRVIDYDDLPEVAVHYPGDEKSIVWITIRVPVPWGQVEAVV